MIEDGIKWGRLVDDRGRGFRRWLGVSTVLYLKIDQNIEVDHVDVRLGDVAKLKGTDEGVWHADKTERIFIGEGG